MIAPADKAVLRLAIGLGLAVLVAYGFALQMPHVVCLMAIMLLCKPGPPIPPVKAAAISLLLAGLLVTGVLMVPLLENYALAGVVLTGAILYALFFFGIRTGNPLTMLLVVAFTLIPVAGVAEQALVTIISVTIAVGDRGRQPGQRLFACLFPDAPAAKAAKPSPPSRETASWIALRGTLVVMPVFVLALTDPSFYLAAIMKSGHSGAAGGFDRHPLGRARAGGIDPDGGGDGPGRLDRPVALAEPVDADAVDDGGRPVGRRTAFRGQAHASPARSGAMPW
jgi:hypothetical protein